MRQSWCPKKVGPGRPVQWRFVPAMVRSSPGMVIWLATRNYLSRELPEARGSGERHGLTRPRGWHSVGHHRRVDLPLRHAQKEDAGRGGQGQLAERAGAARRNDGVGPARHGRSPSLLPARWL